MNQSARFHVCEMVRPHIDQTAVEACEHHIGAQNFTTVTCQFDTSQGPILEGAEIKSLTVLS